MKRFLTSEKSFYKANLHNHSTASDGRLTPEEIKEEYMKRGYSIVAFTDHGVLVPQSHLTDDKFLALSGFEIGCAEYKFGDPRYPIRKNCDIGIICPTPLFPKTKYEGIWIKYDSDTINDIMKTYRDAGCFVIHNHPDWSLERYPDYMKFEYMHATEIFNYSSYIGGYINPTEHVLDDMLSKGLHVFAVAADDNHDKKELEDSFGAWCVINAEALEYGTVMDALFDGSFYSSRGPEIRELYLDDEGVLHAETSDAEMIAFITGSKMRSANRSKDGIPVNSASYTLKPEMRYVRVVVTDFNGKCAYSNPIFLDN